MIVNDGYVGRAPPPANIPANDETFLQARPRGEVVGVSRALTYAASRFRISLPSFCVSPKNF